MSQPAVWYVLDESFSFKASVDWDVQPAMSSLLHHLPSWEKLSSIWTSRFSSNREKSSTSSSSHNRKRSDYKGLKDAKIGAPEESHEMAPVKSLSDYIHSGNPTEMRTYVHTGKPSEVEEDVIHLQYNVEQESNITGSVTKKSSRSEDMS